jgi:hypothetical protein
MSGKIVNNVFRASGVIAATPGGLDWSTAVVTGSTLTATAGKGYFINTTSNVCTVTLPSSAEIGDQIVFADYARTWSTNNVIIDSNGLNFQGDPDTYTVDYSTAGQSLNIVYSDATKGWLPVSDDAVADVGTAPQTQKAIFGFGSLSGSIRTSITNLVNSSGVVASDTTGVGTARSMPGAANYGSDKAIFAFGYDGSVTNTRNLVNNSGVVAADASGAGTGRETRGTSYGVGKAIFAFGSGNTNVSNLVSDEGVVASDGTGVGTGRTHIAATMYGSSGQALFAFGVGASETQYSLKNLVTNVGVIGSDVTGVGTARYGCQGITFGVGLALIGYGNTGPPTYPNQNITNKISNLGIIATDTTGVGTARNYGAGARYGADKGIMGFGDAGGQVSMTNLISNTGVVAADVTGVGSARHSIAAAGYSLTA